MELISREIAADHMRVLVGDKAKRIIENKDILPTIESRPKGRLEA